MPTISVTTRTIQFALMSGLLAAGLVGCRSPDNVLPTLAPTLSQPTNAPTDPRPTAIPESTPTTVSPQPPTLPLLPTHTATPVVLTQTPPDIPPTDAPPSVTATIGPPHVVNSNGALTIIFTADQLNLLLTTRFASDPLPGFSAPPHAVLLEGALQLNLIMPAAAQPITLTLTLAALSTTLGRQLDVRAVALSALKGVTTLQVKPAQQFLTDALIATMQQEAASTSFDVTYVAVSRTNLTLTLTAH